MSPEVCKGQKEKKVKDIEKITKIPPSCLYILYPVWDF